MIIRATVTGVFTLDHLTLLGWTADGATQELIEDARNRMAGYRRTCGDRRGALVAVIEAGEVLEIRPAF